MFRTKDDFIQRLYTDRNGKVSRDEYIAAFDRMDKDGGSQIESTEAKNSRRASYATDLNLVFTTSRYNVLMGKVKNGWRNIEGVLKWYDERLWVARRRYRVFGRTRISRGGHENLKRQKEKKLDFFVGR